MRVRFRLLAAVSLLSSVGCSTIAGLSDLQEVDCDTLDCYNGVVDKGGAAGAAGSAGAGAAGAAGTNAGAAGAVAGNAGAAGAVAGTAGAAGAPGGSGGAAGGGFGGTTMMGGASGNAGNAGTSACIPKTCAEVGAECGTPPDGCGSTLNCPACTDPNLTCGVTTASGLIPFVCGCTPNTYKCDGAALLQCTPDGQGFILAANCGTAGQCNPGTPPDMGSGGAAGAAGAGAGGDAGAAGANPGSPGIPGTCLGCATGATLCQGLQAYTCTDGTFTKTGPECTSDATTPGACDPSNGGSCKTCVPSAFSCAGPKLQQCDTTGTTLADVTTCASNALCEKSIFTGVCVAPVCQPEERRCAGDKSQVCGPNRDQFVDDVTCASAALCVNGSCATPQCAPGETKCSGKTLQVCNADRTAFEKSSDCVAPTPACDLVPVAGGAAKAQCTVRGPALVSLPGAEAYIHATEVTNSDYNAFLDANVATSTQTAECAWNDSFGTPSAAAVNLPRGDVDWCDAKAYCSWAGMQLCGRIGMPGAHVSPGEVTMPAVDQWVAFCGGDSHSSYPYGDAFDEAKCNGFTTAEPAPTPGPTAVGSKKGCAGVKPIYDMSGNVAEWEDACVAYDGQTDKCFARGGSYASTTDIAMKCTNGEQLDRDTRRPDVGFRCCVQ
jgi:formylglycine-generating enzyme